MISHKYFINAFLCYTVKQATSSRDPYQDLICCFSLLGGSSPIPRTVQKYKKASKVSFYL